MTISRFSFPTTIHFGPGARKLVAAHLQNPGIRRPLIVTDRGIAPLPMLQAFVADLAGPRRRRVLGDLGQSGPQPGRRTAPRRSRRTAPMR